MNDMKCPFCGRKLGRKNINDIMCSNEKCVSWKGNFYGSEDLWKELIRTRKALDVAVDEINKIKVAAESVGIGFFMTAAISALVKIKAALNKGGDNG